MAAKWFDIAVLGGGPAGLATATEACRAGLSVLVIERGDYEWLRPGEHLPPSARPVLERLGVLDALDSGQHAACPGTESAWEEAQMLRKDYLFHRHRKGWNLSRPAFDRQLLAIARSNGALVWTKALDVRIAKCKPGWRIARIGCDLRSRMLVDASGRRASGARVLGLVPTRYDKLVAEWGIFSPGRTFGAAPLLLEADEDGWWYSLVLSDQRVIAAFLTDGPLLRARTWDARLASSPKTRERIALAGHPIDRRITSARSQALPNAVSADLVAVGDAALARDPLSSGGIENAIRGGLQAAEAIHAYLNGNADLLAAYEEDAAHLRRRYLRERLETYSRVTRWPDAPFWKERQGFPSFSDYEATLTDPIFSSLEAV